MIQRSIRIAVLAEYSEAFAPHPATNDAIQHSARVLGITVEPTWIPTDTFEDSTLTHFDGLWIAPGSPYRSLTKTLRAIELARTESVPCLGTCGGFQHMILEYARNVLEIPDASHAEYDPYASRHFIAKLDCSLVGRELKVALRPDSKVAQAYGASEATERYYCNFGVAPETVPYFRTGPLRIVGSDVEGEARIVELDDHPFFVGTLFVPQSRSRPDAPHPLVSAFLNACRSD